MKNQQHPLIHIFQAGQGDQKIGKKFAKNFGKKVAQTKNAKYVHQSST
jgi:hypothetical protein